MLLQPGKEGTELEPCQIYSEYVAEQWGSIFLSPFFSLSPLLSPPSDRKSRTL